MVLNKYYRKTYMNSTCGRRKVNLNCKRLETPPVVISVAQTLIFMFA